MFSDLDIWLNHFEYHAEHPRQVPAGLDAVLKPSEQKLIASSIATFQLGEQSDGISLLVAAWKFAKKHDEPKLIRLIELFIKEEQRHAALLLEFMEAHQIKRKHADWTDFVFCVLRKTGGLELRLHILMTAEIIGCVFYRALEAATGCQQLKVLCRTLVADELAHIGFESQLLLTMRAQRPQLTRTLLRLTHRTFFKSTARIVYLTNAKVLRAAGYNLRTFTKACEEQYAFYLEPPVRVRQSALRELQNLRPQAIARRVDSKHG